MKARLATVVLLTGSMLALPGASIPSAHAITLMNSTFVATISISGGLGYPVTTGDPLNTLPITISPVCLALPGDLVATNCHNDYQFTRKPITFASIVCTDESASVASSLPSEHVGNCSFAVGSGYLTGHCGLLGGQIHGFYVNSLGQVFHFDIHINGVGSTIDFSGHWVKLTTHTFEPQDHGLVGGDMAVLLSTTKQSCMAGNVTELTVLGDAAWVSTPQ